MVRKFNAVVSLWLFFSPLLFAAELDVGSVFPELLLQDQYDKKAAIPSDAEILIFTADKAGADQVNTYLQDQPANHLSQHKARFVSDISGMPSMITRLFALPKMRERPYSIYLARDEESVSFIPRRKGHVTAIYLREGQVTDIKHVSPQGDLGQVFNHTASSQQ